MFPPVEFHTPALDIYKHSLLSTYTGSSQNYIMNNKMKITLIVKTSGVIRHFWGGFSNEYNALSLGLITIILKERSR